MQDEDKTPAASASGSPVVPDPSRNPPASANPTGAMQHDGENSGGSGTPQLAWVADNRTYALGLAFLLICLYIAPLLLVGYGALTTGGFKEPSALLTWFSAFIKGSDSTLSEYHKLLFPVIAAISIVVFKDKPGAGFIGLVVFLLFAYVGTIFLAVLFEITSIKEALQGLPDPVDMRLVKLFFTRMQETLLMYLMMLLGISVSNKAKA